MDFVIFFPVLAYLLWGPLVGRRYHQGLYVLSVIFFAVVHIGCIKRWGGTPGKLICGLRVVKANLEPAGWKEAWLRYSVDLGLHLLSTLLLLNALEHISDQTYGSYGRGKLMTELSAFEGAPGEILGWIGNLWTIGELLFLLTNRRRRALHDYIAGTVVVRSRSLRLQA